MNNEERKKYWQITAEDRADVIAFIREARKRSEVKGFDFYACDWEELENSARKDEEE